MRLSDWINDIRWKYFTNEKAGLIFKELMKEFQEVNKMTEKRFTTDGIDIIDNRQLIEYVVLEKQGRELVVDLLNEQSDKITEQAIQIDFLKDENKHMRQVLEENRQLKQFKELFCAVLKQEYEDRTNEMNRWVEKEDWNGYRATKLEYGTVIRIAKRIGVDLE